MSQNHLRSDGTTSKLADTLQKLFRQLRLKLYANLRAFHLPFLERVPKLWSTILPALLIVLFKDVFIRLIRGDGHTRISRNWWHRLYTNLGAFFSRLLEYTQDTASFSSVDDYWSLVLSIWSRRVVGPDVVYPMLRIRKRQSGRLARLILEHCSAANHYERYAKTAFPQGIDPPCVAVVDLDKVPRHISQNGYSTQVDFYGLMCVPIFLGTGFALASNESLYDWKLSTALGQWTAYARYTLAFCIYAVFRGDGILSLSRSSNASTPGCAVLLDQDFTVILNGSQSVLEAIAEHGFNLSHPNAVWRPGVRVPSAKGHYRYLSQDAVEILCDSGCLAAFELYWLLFCPSTTALEQMTPFLFTVINIFRLRGFLPQLSMVDETVLGKAAIARILLPFFCLHRVQIMKSAPLFSWQQVPVLSSLTLFALFLFAYKPRDYPIGSAKFLDTLGRPPVTKWQFDTLAAAATFQCLVICDGTSRPVTSINVSAFLDMLIPDERDVWKAWKERVADRIVHEMDISFAPTTPTFADERQVQLRDLLAEAQSGYDIYSSSYVSRVPRDPIFSLTDHNRNNLWLLGL